jgi:magnesium-transporting ATPase (P-type)
MEAPRPHLRSAEYQFEHSMDGSKFTAGVGWWLSCAILWGCTFFELASSTVTEQTLDDTAIPSWFYAFVLFVGFVTQFAWTFYVLITTGSSMPRFLAVLSMISLFIWMCNVVAAFIHFAIAERGVFAFLPSFLLLNTTIWLGFIYYWYVGPKAFEDK